MRQVKVYPVIRECHMNVDDENVQEACDRLVQVLMRDEEGEGKDELEQTGQAQIEAPRVDDDNEVTELF
jgi:hypothetical protein